MSDEVEGSRGLKYVCIEGGVRFEQFLCQNATVPCLEAFSLNDDEADLNCVSDKY